MLTSPRKRVIEWFCNCQLREYRSTFRAGNGDVGVLAGIFLLSIKRALFR